MGFFKTTFFGIYLFVWRDQQTAHRSLLSFLLHEGLGIDLGLPG